MADPASNDDDLEQLQRLRDIARSLGCLTEFDFCLLAKITRNTAESWRKHGKGPPHILLGNRYLYPLDHMAEHLQRTVREGRRGVVL